VCIIEVTSGAEDENPHTDKDSVKHAAEETCMDAGETSSNGALFFLTVNCQNCMRERESLFATKNKEHTKMY